MVQSQFRVAFFFALVAALGCGRSGPAAPAGPPSLVLITIDTLRADRVGRGIARTLDDLAARGVQFTNARAAAPLTLPSHVSMLTGALPPAHGVRENGVDVFAGTPPSVARRLKNAGYRAAACVGAYVLDRRFGLADGFDHYDDQIARDPDAVQLLEAERPANEVVDRAIAWLGSGRGQSGVRAGSEQGQSGVRAGSDPGLTPPLFLWVHLYDPHAPYVPPAEFLQRAGGNTYDGEVAFADAQVGRLLEAIRARGVDPAIVVAGDHGESLGEHGERTHGMLAYEAALRVPLIVAGPGIVPARRDDPVSLIDIAHTILAISGSEGSKGSEGSRDSTGSESSGGSEGSGRNLLAAPRPDREIYAETEYPRVAGWSPVYALVQDRWKLILSRGPELFDLATDPGETTNLAAARQPLANAMATRIEALRTPAQPRTARAASPEVAERLRALGYVAGSGAPPKPGDGPNPADHITAWAEFESLLAEMGGDRQSAVGSRQSAIGRSRDAALFTRLTRLAREHPGAPVFQAAYARELSERGQTAAALQVYRRAVARWPDDPTLFHELAVAARKAGRADEAMKAEQAALALDPSLASAHNGAGLLLTDADRHADAAAAFERAVKGDPTNAEYLVNLGNARRAAGNATGAADAYRQAAAIDPRSPDAANGLGVLLVQQQRPADAIPWFEQALAAAPDFLEARLNLAIAHQESGNRDRAAAIYRDLLANAPPDARERRAAADLLRSLGR